MISAFFSFCSVSLLRGLRCAKTAERIDVLFVVATPGTRAVTRVISVCDDKDSIMDLICRCAL